MGLSELTGKVTEVVPLNNFNLTDLPPEIISKISGLITILKAAGIVFIGYIVFLIVKWVLGIKRYRNIKQIYKKVNEIDRKLDLLLKNKIKKEETKKRRKKKQNKKK